MIFFKLLAIVVGTILAATSAYALTSTVGGIDTIAGRTIIALALGVVTGSIVVGTLADRYTAAIILTAMLAGECYSLAGTAERVMAAREAQQVPLREARAKHDAAAEALARAQAAKPVPASRDRLGSAEVAKKAADVAVTAKAAEMGCKANCAALLQSQADAAAREVEAARRELAAHDEAEAKRIAAGIGTAQATLDAAPMPANVSPLADFLHITPRTLDLAMAACLSLGLNGMAAALITVGAHSIHRRAATPTLAKPRLVSTSTPALSVIDFGANALEASPGAKLDFEEFSNAYDRAAQAARKRALTAEEFTEPFKTLCVTAGIRTAKRGSKVFLCDVKLAS